MSATHNQPSCQTLIMGRVTGKGSHNDNVAAIGFVISIGFDEGK